MLKLVLKLITLFLFSLPLNTWAFGASTGHDELDYIGAFGKGELIVDTSSIEIVKHGPRDSMKIALTFDDGPFVVTAKILDTLAAHDVKATFFLVGKQVEKYPKIAKRIVDEGHEIGNHTYSHKYLTRVDKTVWKYQIDQCSVTIYKATGVLPALFRAPYNLYNNEILDYVSQAGMTLVEYDVDPRDWVTEPTASIKQRILKDIKPGAIIVCHDLSSKTRSALGSIIDSLQSSGYELVTVGEIVKDLAIQLSKSESLIKGEL
jgi:peptidoglycan/xylan/chitin deacetylase (PgdA/CDA1 family)